MNAPANAWIETAQQLNLTFDLNSVLDLGHGHLKLVCNSPHGGNLMMHICINKCSCPHFIGFTRN